MGAKSAQGTFTINLNAGVTVSKVVVKVHSFYASSADHPTNANYLKVNEVNKASGYNATATPEDVTYDITAASSITFTSTNADGTGIGRVCIYSIALYA